MIRYKKYQNQTKSTPLSGKWLARAVADETLDTRALAEHMAKHNTPYSQGAIHGVLKDMTSCIKELLLDGKNVKLDDLAIFGVGIRGKPADTSKDWSVTYQRGRAAPQMPRHRNPRHQPADNSKRSSRSFHLTTSKSGRYRRWRRGG